MLVLLPPSEQKAEAGDGPPVALDRLTYADSLTDLRRRVVDAVDPALLAAATLPAGRLYRGILYGALDLAALPAAARRRADRSLLVLSGVWGVSRPADHLAPYRLQIGTRLPGLPPLPTLWRPAMHEALDRDVARHGALDLRSSGYRDMYRPSPAAAERLVTVTVRTTSYTGKVVKGALVATMLRAGAPSYDGLLAAADALGLPATADGHQVTVTAPSIWRPSL